MIAKVKKLFNISDYMKSESFIEKLREIFNDIYDKNYDEITV